MANNDLQEVWKFIAALDERSKNQTTLIDGLQKAREKSGNYTIAALVTVVISLFGLLMTVIINLRK